MRVRGGSWGHLDLGILIVPLYNGAQKSAFWFMLSCDMKLF